MPHTAKTFEEAAKKLYADVVYGNVLTLAKSVFGVGQRTILDVCSGPGLLTKLLRDNHVGDRHVLIDCDSGFLDAAKELNPNAVICTTDILDGRMTLPEAHGALFINTSGYFTLSELESVLRWISHASPVLIANFFVAEDQKDIDKLFVSKRRTHRRGNRYWFDIDEGDGRFSLLAFPWRELKETIEAAGWIIDGEIRYVDFKPERLLILRRKP